MLQLLLKKDFVDESALRDRAGVNALRLDDGEAVEYLERLKERVGYVRRLYTRQDLDPGLGPQGVLEFLELVCQTLTALEQRQLLHRRNVIGTPLTIDPTGSGFPTFTECLLLDEDRGTSEERLAQLPARAEITEQARREILAGRFPTEQQKHRLLLDYLTMVHDRPCLRQLEIARPVLVGESASQCQFHAEWYGVESATNLPVHYLMAYAQDRRRKEDCANEELMHRLEVGFSQHATPRSTAAYLDEMPNVHPKFVRKFTLGSYHTRHTLNDGPEGELLGTMDDAFMLRFAVEVSGSVDTQVTRTWSDRLLRRQCETERFGPSLLGRRLIVPTALKERLGDRDEHGEPCVVYGVDEEGEIGV
jgi:hypothetical protein